jgi:hypothetical protein
MIADVTRSMFEPSTCRIRILELYRCCNPYDAVQVGSSWPGVKLETLIFTAVSVDVVKTIKLKCVLRSDDCGVVDVGRSLWREDGSVVYNCSWFSPEQSFSGPSLVGLVTIFYSLRFETSSFVASYDSQGYGGGIGRRLHMRVFPTYYYVSTFYTSVRTE